MFDLTLVIFKIDVVALAIILAGTTWSILVPGKRIWPPPRRLSWQYMLTWISFLVVFGCNGTVIALDWNTWMFRSELRFVAGLPLALIGGLLAVWGIYTLGMKNSLGQRAGFFAVGPYRFTRNPQYLGNIVFLIGVSLVANSALLWISHLLLCLVFLMTPWCEEPWLEEQYGRKYVDYRGDVPRFL